MENAEILRPKKLSDFIGKPKLKLVLNAMIEATKSRAEPIDHILFTGNAGLGKTTLAKIIANELHKDIKAMIGNNINESIARELTTLKDGDILFIDEIHRIPTKWQELLYPAMESFKTFYNVGNRRFSTNIEIDTPRFTLIGATTDIGLLTKPLRDRFGIVFELDPYTIDELKKIIENNILTLDLKLKPLQFDDISTAIAQRARFTPRIANNLLKRIRDFTAGDVNDITLDRVLRVFEILEINENGIDSNDIKYLTLLEKYGIPLGITNLSASTGIDRTTVERVIEPYLLQNEYILRTGRGRIITQKGKDVIKNIKKGGKV